MVAPEVRLLIVVPFAAPPSAVTDIVTPALGDAITTLPVALILNRAVVAVASATVFAAERYNPFVGTVALDGINEPDVTDVSPANVRAVAPRAIFVEPIVNELFVRALLGIDVKLVPVIVGVLDQAGGDELPFDINTCPVEPDPPPIVNAPVEPIDSRELPFVDIVTETSLEICKVCPVAAETIPAAAVPTLRVFVPGVYVNPALKVVVFVAA